MNVFNGKGFVMDLIDGVATRDLKIVPDERGFLMEMFRSDWEEFERFGQVYVTATYPGVVKAWHYHKKQTDHFIPLSGMSKVVLYDPREGSKTRGMVNEFFIGEQKRMLIKIPQGVYHGFKGIDTKVSLIVNVPTRLYDYNDPDEHRVPWDDPSIPYDWDRKNG